MTARGWGLGVGALLGSVHLLPQTLRTQWIYLPDALQRGEPARWLLCHLVHRSWEHLLGNLVTWGLACWLTAPVLRWTRGKIFGGVAVACAISASLSQAQPVASPFVGFSALTYAWLVAGSCLGVFRTQYRARFGGLLLCLAMKWAFEAMAGRGLGFAGVLQTGEPATLVHAHALAWGLVWGALLLLVAPNSRSGPAASADLS